MNFIHCEKNNILLLITPLESLVKICTTFLFYICTTFLFCTVLGENINFVDVDAYFIIQHSFIM